MSLSVRRYKKGECITFKSTKGNYGALSNMAPNFPINIDGMNILTAEALYQALRFPDYPEIQKKIISFTSPISSKQYGRSVIQFTRPDWIECRFQIMRFCIALKLYQNFDKFSELLLKTNNLPLVEYTEKDKVWGAILEGEYYIGTNALGRLLMELRQKIQTDDFEFDIPEIYNLTFLGKRIKLSSLKR